MVIKENFFDEIDNDVMVSSTEETYEWCHHIVIIFRIKNTKFSENTKALFKSMILLVDNILDDYQFSISQKYDEPGDIITKSSFDDYYNDVLCDENYIKNISTPNGLLLMHILFNEELSFVDHVYLMNTIGLIVQNMFINKEHNDVWKTVQGVVCDSATLVNSYSPDPQKPSEKWFFVVQMIEQYKKVYGVDVIPEQQIKKVFSRYGAPKNNIGFLSRCTYVYPVNNSDDNFSVI